MVDNIFGEIRVIGSWINTKEEVSHETILEDLKIIAAANPNEFKKPLLDYMDIATVRYGIPEIMVANTTAVAIAEQVVRSLG